MSEIKLSEELKEESKRNLIFFKVLGFPDIIFDIQALEAENKGLKASFIDQRKAWLWVKGLIPDYLNDPDPLTEERYQELAKLSEKTKGGREEMSDDYLKKQKEADKLMMSTKIELVDKFQAMEAENKRLKEGLKVIENHAYQYGKGEPYFLGIQRIFEKRKLKFTNGQ